MSLAFADNTSTGIEPVFDWVGTRTLEAPDGRRETLPVQNHAWRLYQYHAQSLGRSTTRLPAAFVTALQIRPEDHIAMVAAVQPWVDGAISKTLNLPTHTRPEAVADALMQAWREGLKGLTVYRPNPVHRAVLRPH